MTIRRKRKENYPSIIKTKLNFKKAAANTTFELKIHRQDLTANSMLYFKQIIPFKRTFRWHCHIFKTQVKLDMQQWVYLSRPPRRRKTKFETSITIQNIPIKMNNQSSLLYLSENREYIWNGN